MCEIVLDSIHLYTRDLFDIQVVDGRDHTLVETLLREDFQKHPRDVKIFLKRYPRPSA